MPPPAVVEMVAIPEGAAVQAEKKRINEAFVMLRTAYEEKGLLPKARDAAPAPAESAAWWIRNDKFRFPEDTAKQRNWPRYPLTAPWPTLTLLAADNQPLREREECWTAFRDKKLRAEWAALLWKQIQGRENYFGPKHKILVDDSATSNTSRRRANPKRTPAPRPSRSCWWHPEEVVAASRRNASQ